jgi:hypothetical protein
MAFDPIDADELASGNCRCANSHMEGIPLYDDDTSHQASGHRKGGPIRGESGDTPVAMATDHRASLLPFAAALLVLLLAGGAAADDASSDDDAGTSRTPGCSNKFQLVMALPLPLAYSIRGRSSLIRSLPVVVGFGVPGVL